MNTVAILPKLCMKTLQRQNTKREVVKKVHFQKNEVATKGVTSTQQQQVQQQQVQQQLQSNQNNFENSIDVSSKSVLVAVTPAPAPANCESLESNIVDKRDENDNNKQGDVITLSLTENGE